MKRLIISVTIIFGTLIYPQGNVYLIIGSDTAIWEGMSVNKYNCYYNYNVIPDNTRNYFEVMQPEYRRKFSDSFGNQLKLTWWLMSGNIFRYSTNLNVPYGNMIVPYEAKKYYGNLFNQYNDELTLHYHTFVWTDYDGDGVYFWNQAKNFIESKSDFYYTLAQMLIEEEIFPVSFRSGWNTMDNEWQAELDKLIPFSMHNEAPAFHEDNSEPIDNVYDWRQASQEFIPYHPYPENYQLLGNGKGWNLHSKYVGNINQSQMNTIFSKAEKTDQVVCLWGHVWDDLFPEYVQRIDSLAKISAATNTNIKFKYCTAVEGMQLWMKNSNSTAPVVEVQQIDYEENVKFRIKTDEKIFQEQPFAALKFIDESYEVIDFYLSRENEWVSRSYYKKSNLAKFALAVCDTFGNQSIKIIRYLPDDIYIDNSDSGYEELSGNWSTNTDAAWALDSRKTILSENDSAKVRWKFTTEFSGKYNLFLQIPKTETPAEYLTFRIYSGGILVYTISFTSSLKPSEWIYLSTQYFQASADNSVEMIVSGKGQNLHSVSADVIKISQLVRQKWIIPSTKNIDLGAVAIDDTIKFNLPIANHGTENLTISKIEFQNNYIELLSDLPLQIQSFKEAGIEFKLTPDVISKLNDTLSIFSDDSFTPVCKVTFSADVTEYFKIVDNEEPDFYKEYGNWAKSVVQAYGLSSRYAYLNQSPKAYAVYNFNIRESGIYDVLSIVPKTVNASNNALYVISQGSRVVDSLFIDQNAGSGNWMRISTVELFPDLPVIIKIIDTGLSTLGAVLRADALKLQLISPLAQDERTSILPEEYALYQNYPNPFNPTTVIKYSIPYVEAQNFVPVQLKVFDVLGKEVATLVNENKPAGSYEMKFEASTLSSGIYFYRIAIHSDKLQAGSFVQTKKMILLR